MDNPFALCIQGNTNNPALIAAEIQNGINLHAVGISLLKTKQRSLGEKILTHTEPNIRKFLAFKSYANVKRLMPRPRFLFTSPQWIVISNKSSFYTWC